MTNASLRDVTGFRGEKIVELCLTTYFPDTGKPLFSPGFLGDKWPAIDFYVELNGLTGERPYFFAQCKATSSVLSDTASKLKISSKKVDVQRLMAIPAPTYILGVHEPSGRVFAKSIHLGVEVKSVTWIQYSNELTISNLRLLFDEVRDYWRSTPSKPSASVFL